MNSNYSEPRMQVRSSLRRCWYVRLTPKVSSKASHTYRAQRDSETPCLLLRLVMQQALQSQIHVDCKAGAPELFCKLQPPSATIVQRDINDS